MPGYPPPGWAPRAPNPSDSRNWALLAHLSALASILGVPSFVGPLVVWLVRRNDDPYAGEHAREALNFNLSVLLYGVAGGIVALILGVATLGFGLLLIIPLLLVGVVLWLVFTIQAAMHASRGERYRYPLTIRFIT